VNRIRLTERRRELMPQVRWCIHVSKRVVSDCDEEDTDGRASVTKQSIVYYTDVSADIHLYSPKMVAITSYNISYNIAYIHNNKLHAYIHNRKKTNKLNK